MLDPAKPGGDDGADGDELRTSQVSIMPSGSASSTDLPSDSPNCTRCAAQSSEDAAFAPVSTLFDVVLVTEWWQVEGAPHPADPSRA